MTLKTPIQADYLFVALAFSVVVLLPGDAMSECAWRPPDSEMVGRGVVAWYADVAGSAQKPAWSLSAGGDKVAIRLGEGADVAVVEVVLAPDCTRSVATKWPAGASAWFNDEQAGRLAAGLGLEAVVVNPGGVDADKCVRAGPDPVKRVSFVDIVLIVVTMVALLVGFLRRRDGAGPLIVDTVLLLAMMLAAAWPIFSVPFSTDAQILRVAYAARDVFGDWNHPFLSYLLNRPSALLSSNPVVLRIVPFIWALLEAFLFSLAARKIAGRVAFALVAIWMASSLRLTMGMIDLSDWNLAGIFLALMVLWVAGPARHAPRLKYVPVAAVLILAGCFSSYMMIVPSVILAVILVLDWRKGRTSVFGPATATGALLFAGWFVFDAFSSGSAIRGGGFTQDLPGMLRAVLISEPPFGLSIFMPGLIVAGFFAGRFRRVAEAWWFCLATFLFSIGALALALVFSAINGAYYFGLFRGTCYLPAAVSVAVAVEWLYGRLTRVGSPGWAAGVVVPVISAMAIFGVTFRVEPVPRGSETAGVGHMPEFAERTGRGQVRVFSNDINASVLLLYSDVLEGRQDIGVIIDDGADTWVHRTVTRFGVDKSDCAGMPARYLVLWRNLGGAGTDERCRPMETDDCVELFIDGGTSPCPESKRTFCYYECHRRTEAGDDTGAR